MHPYLVSASPENLKTTLLNSVPVEDVLPFLTASQRRYLMKLTSCSRRVRCWAMTENLRKHFNQIEAGDVVLFSEHKTGRFGYAARVTGKLESERLGNRLWPFNRQSPWKLIYVLDNVTEISVSKPGLLAELGYDPKDAVQKSRRVRDEAIERVVNKYGSITNLFGVLGVYLPWLDAAQLGTPEVEQCISSGAGFGDPELNKRVERRAVEHVTKQYEDAGWTVESVEADKCGYDLLCKNGGDEEHVEVKGVRGAALSFIITAGEVRRAKRDSRFVLQVVTETLSERARSHRFTRAEFEERFALAEIAYRASLRPGHTR
jgi:hypothetical protein